MKTELLPTEKPSAPEAQFPALFIDPNDGEVYLIRERGGSGTLLVSPRHPHRVGMVYGPLRLRYFNLQRLDPLHAMKIITTDWIDESRVESFEQHFVRTLNADAAGMAENAQETARNSCGAFGRLVGLLAERGLLNINDVIHVSTAYASKKMELAP